ncbi:MAG: hypothetical protein EON54_00215 [Alcaligenaceae bacterium]|nr:MAG: hypothetical protein EON54_00215 [Alcaligenaceae bacterium]
MSADRKASALLIAKMYQQEILAARSAGRLFSERNVLAVLSEAVLSNAPIDPEFQALANATIAKAFIDGKLPTPGRRETVKNYDPATITTEFFEFIDGVGLKGASPLTEDEARIQLALIYELDETTIKRAVQSERWLHGDTKAAREQKRKSVAFLEAAIEQTRKSGALPDGSASRADDSSPVGLAFLKKDAAIALLRAIIRPIPRSTN